MTAMRQLASMTNGLIEWKAPTHIAAAGWKHRNLSRVEQEWVLGSRRRTRRHRRPCGVQLSSAAETRGRVAAQKTFDDPSDMKRVQAEHATRGCRESPIFSQVDLRTFLVLTTHVMLCKSEIRRRQKSSTTWLIWTQPHLNRKLTRCGCWPQSPQWSVEATNSESLWDPVSSSQTNSWPKQTSLEQCMSVSSCVKTQKLNLPSFAKALASVVSITSWLVHDHAILQEKRAAEIFDEDGQRSLERLFPGFTEDSSEQATLSVRTTPQMTRFRDVQQAINMATV